MEGTGGHARIHGGDDVDSGAVRGSDGAERVASLDRIGAQDSTRDVDGVTRLRSATS